MSQTEGDIRVSPELLFRIKFRELSKSPIFTQKNMDSLNPEKIEKLKPFLGGKGTSLFLMNNLGLNTPLTTVLTSEVGNLIKVVGFEKLPQPLQRKIQNTVNKLVKDGSRSFANGNNPLLLAVRSGAKFSMPGAMDTITNIGITTQNVDVLGKKIGEDVAWQSYLTFCTGWVSSVFGEPIENLNNLLEPWSQANKSKTESYKQQVLALKKWLDVKYKQKIPDDPWEQLYTSIKAIYDSWDSPETINYRQQHGLPDDAGTAVVINEMLHGNKQSESLSGIGVVFSEDKNNISFVKSGTGEEIVSGSDTGDDVLTSKLIEQISLDVKVMQKHWQGHKVDMEFVIVDGELYWIQARKAKLSPVERLKMALEQLDKNSSDQDIREFLQPHILAGLQQSFEKSDLDTEKSLLNGAGIGGYANKGQIVLTTTAAEEQLKLNDNNRVVLFANMINSEHVRLSALYKERFMLVTLSGSQNSHKAVVLNNHGSVGSVGCGQDSFKIKKDGIKIGSRLYSKDQIVSIDGSSGEVYFADLGYEKGNNLTKLQKELIERRKNIGVSMYEILVQIMGLDDAFAAALERSKEDLSGWDSKKAQAQVLLNNVMEGMESLMQVKPFKIGNKKEIIKLLRKWLSDGWDATIRSAFKYEGVDRDKLGFNPWMQFRTLFKIRSNRLIRSFLYNLPDEFKELYKRVTGKEPKYGSLSAWNRKFADLKLKEILACRIPRDTLNDNEKEEHLVATMKMNNGTEPEVRVEIYPNTPHLRSFEENNQIETRGGFKQNHLITLIAKVGTENPNGINRVNYGFGSDHINKHGLDALLDRFIKYRNSGERLTVTEKAVFRLISDKLYKNNNESRFEVDQKNKVGFFIKDLLKNAEIPNEVLESIVTEHSLAIAKEMEWKIFEDQWRELIPRLAAIDTMTDQPITLEMQARLPKNGSLKHHSDGSWFMIYGLKGIEEAVTGKE